MSTPRDPQISRRHLLVLSSSAAALAACGTAVNSNDGSTVNDAMNASDTGNDTNTSQDSSATDSASPDVSTACDNTPGQMVGAVTDFAVGTWTLLRSPHVIVSQDSGGLYAYSSICTHEGCTLGAPDTSGDARCPCHFSTFDGNGMVVPGSRALRNLSHYAVEICEGNVYVNTTMTVTASTRTPVV